MKILSIFLLFTLCMVRVYSQSKLPLRADTVTVEKTGGVANLQVKDATKDSMGIVYNIGNGVYRNKRLKKLNDSTFVAGNDTISLAGGGGASSGHPSLTYKYNAFGGIGGILSPGEAAYTYDSITNTLYVDTINLKKAMTDTVRFRPSVLTPNGLRISANGNSYTVGTAATDLDDSSYIGITSSRYNMPVDNIAVTGSGAINATYQHFVNVSYPHTYMTTLMTGLNTLRIGGGTSKNYRKIVNAYKNIFCNHFSKTFYPASNNTHITRHGGGWNTGWASSSGGGKGGTQGAFTANANDSIKFNFTDSTVWFSIIAGDGSGSIYTSPDIDIYIDNVLIENYDLNNQTDGTADGSFDGRLTPIVRYYTGLTYGVHTIKIVNKANLYLLFDGFGTLVDRNSANTYVGYHVPKMTAAGYATAPANSSDAITDTMNVKLDSLFATFPSWYPSFLVPVNNYYFPNSGDVTAGVDDVHPNNQGHRHIADATFAMLGNGANNVESGTVIYTLGNLYLKNDTGAIVKIIAGDVVYNQGQTILNDTMRIGAHNDKPVAIISNGQTAASFRQNQGVYGNVADFYGPTRAFGPVYAEAANIELRRSWTFSGGVSNSIGTWTGGGTGWGLSENFIGTANSRFWGLMVQENGFFGRLVNDAGTFTNWLDVRRTGTHADSISFPMGKIYLGEMTRVASADSVLTWDVATQQVRLTPASGGADGNGIYSADGTLAGDRTVSTGGFTTTWSGANDNETSFNVTNTGSSAASAIAGNVTGSTGAGVTGTSTTGNGVVGTSSSNYGVVGTSSTTAAFRGQINVASTDAIENIVSLLRTSSAGAGANGLGAAIQFELETATSGTSQTAGRLAFSWSDATNATRTSVAEIYGVNSATTARKAALAGNGQWTWDGYGAGTHTVTPATTPVMSASGVVGERIAPKIYTALLTATAGNAPTATVLGTNEIGSIVWTRVADGNYTGTLSSAFTANKTWAMVQRGDMTGNFVNNWISSGSTSTVTLTVSDNLGNPVGDFTNMSIEIRVYP